MYPARGHPADTMDHRSASPDRYTCMSAAQANAVPVHDALTRQLYRPPPRPHAGPRGLTQAPGVVCTGPDRPQRVGPAGLPAPGGLPPAHRRGHPSSARPCADIGPIRFIHYLHGDQESCRWSLAGGSSTLYIVLGNESSMQEFHGQAARNLPPNLNASRWLTPKSVQLAQQNPQAAPLQHKWVGRAVYAMDR